jgi:hypothetical protein
MQGNGWGKKCGKESEIFLLSGYITKKNVDNEKYPPFLELHVMRNVAFGLSIEIQSNLEITPAIPECQRNLPA